MGGKANIAGGLDSKVIGPDSVNKADGDFKGSFA